MSNPYIHLDLDLSYVAFTKIEQAMGYDGKKIWIDLEGGSTLLLTKEQVRQLGDWLKAKEEEDEE